MRLRVVAVVALASLASGCTSSGSDDAKAEPAPSTASPSAPVVAAAGPAALQASPDPGYAVVLAEKGVASRTVTLPRAVSGGLRLSYSCVGTGRIRLRLNGNGPESDCNGQPLGADMEVKGQVSSVEVTVEAGVRWNLLVQESNPERLRPPAR